MPYSDPQRRKQAARDSMRRKRSSPEALAQERRDKAIDRGSDRRSSTVYADNPEQAKARHGFIDRLSYNYGHQEGGKPRRGDLKSIRVARRNPDFVPDESGPSFDLKLRGARTFTKPFPDGSDPLFNHDLEARRWFEYLSVRDELVSIKDAVNLAALLRRLGVDANRVAGVIRQHSDLAPVSRPTVHKASGLTDGQFATAILILKRQGLLQEHTNTWPPEYTITIPTARRG